MPPMEVLDRVGPEHLRALVVGYRDALAVHREALNRLNVYPVPDGDTGTNMALTLESVVAELPPPGGEGDGRAQAEMAAVCRAVAHGSLMGARGNSGVILSQLLRGFTDELAATAEADGATVADALATAGKAAYSAVMHPVEGTILTVAREAADAAVAARDRRLVDILEAAAEAGRGALARTPELLAVLAEAGVVDAGGAGFVLFLEAFLQVVTGRPVPAPAVPEETGTAGGAVPANHRDGQGTAGPRYEVMFLLDAPEEAVVAFKEAWDGMGDSIVVVGGDGTWNCHIHTDHIGEAVEAGIRAGRPHRVEVTDLHEQVTSHRCVDDGSPAAGEEAVTATVSTGVVAVGAGDGIGHILRSLGVRRVVTGGQSMNPSTAEILAAVEEVAAKEILILPNNKNVVAVAEQAAAAASRPVSVVPTTTVTEAFAALLTYDPDAPAEVNARSMAAAVDRIVTAEVVQAVRQASTPVGPVEKGDWMGVTPSGIAVVAPTAAEAAIGVLDELLEDHHELVTLVEGRPSSPSETRQVTGWLAASHPEVAVEVHDGGQPLAAWLLSVE
jgi:DAK2 domain fusion protein YloV